MTTMEYLKEAPKGTTKSTMQRIVQTHNGDSGLIKKAIKDLWLKHEEENSWVEVAPKQKKKAPKPVTNNYRGKKQYNGHHNGPRKPTWNQNQQQQKFNNAPPNPKAVEETVLPPKNSWASKLFKPEPEERKPVPQKVLPPPTVPPPIERKKVQEKPKKKQAVDVTQIEAELFKESEEKAKKQKAPEPPKPKVKAGVAFSTSIKKKAESFDVANIGRVSFGKSGVEFNLATLAENEGKELVPKGTLAKLKQAKLDLERVRDEVNHLKARENEVQAEISQEADKSMKYSIRVQELEAEAKEKANLREEVSKLTKQLEEHQLQTRQYYDRINEDPKKGDKEPKPPQPPANANPPQPGYSMPQQQPVYPGMQYFPGYYSQFHHYPPQSPGPGHPSSRYGYEGQVSHPPPSHPPGPSPSPPPEHHGHFSHEEFRGMRRPPPPSSREMAMDKKAQHTAPPGYGGQQHPYSYPAPNMVYPQQQQQQHFPPGQGQQKWNGGR